MSAPKVIGRYQQSVVYWSEFDFDVKYYGMHHSHRDNINECLMEFADRNETTARYLISTFGFNLEVSHPVHYSVGDNISKARPHFNITANGKIYHVFTTKNHRRIIAVSEILNTEFPF